MLPVRISEYCLLVAKLSGVMVALSACGTDAPGSVPSGAGGAAGGAVSSQGGAGGQSPDAGGAAGGVMQGDAGAFGGAGEQAGTANSGGADGMGGAASPGGAGGIGGAASPGGAGGMGGAGGSMGGGLTNPGEDRCDVGVHDAAQPPAALSLSGSLGVHDPVIIEQNGSYHLFATGPRISRKVSEDLRSWRDTGQVFPQIPSWVAGEISGVTNLWAPDISYFGGQYHLYYSASTFGSNHSCIGHATVDSLDGGGAFTDHGPVICSNSAGANDDWNAIDPNVIIEPSGKAWLSFGSFWGGLKLIELDESGARAGDSLIAIAARPRAGGALEAPFIVRRCGYYYLFLSWDKCCDGVNSTYNIRVGRSSEVAGPYVDRDGVDLTDGGGTLVLEGSGRWNGPGHNAIFFTQAEAYNVYHSYDGDRNGSATLRISDLVWDAEGWPISGGP